MGWVYAASVSAVSPALLGLPDNLRLNRISRRRLGMSGGARSPLLAHPVLIEEPYRRALLLLEQGGNEVDAGRIAVQVPGTEGCAMYHPPKRGRGAGVEAVVDRHQCLQLLVDVSDEVSPERAKIDLGCPHRR